MYALYLENGIITKGLLLANEAREVLLNNEIHE